MLADHVLRHYRAAYGDDEASVVIADSSIYAGSRPRRALRLIREWQRLHQDELTAAWERTWTKIEPGTIDPQP